MTVVGDALHAMDLGAFGVGPPLVSFSPAAVLSDAAGADHGAHPPVGGRRSSSAHRRAIGLLALPVQCSLPGAFGSSTRDTPRRLLIVDLVGSVGSDANPILLP